MFRRRPPSRSRLNCLIYLTVILTVPTSLCALGPVGVTTGTAGGIVPTAFTVAPTNDNFANAQPILGASGVILGSNVGATKESLERNHAGRTGGKSVWYVWQAPNDGNFVFTTQGTSFATALAVYTGNSLPGNLVKENDIEAFACSFSGFPQSSRVAFPAVGGVFYHIAVDLRVSDAAPGNITLRWGRSVSITGRISDASGIPTAVAENVTLNGDICRITEGFSTISFHEVPAGGSYNVIVSSSGKNFVRWGTDQSISPLAGDVSNYNYYQQTPAYSITGSITVPGGNLSGVTITCTATGAALFSTSGFINSGSYSCSGLPTNANYVVTATKVGLRFSPPNWTINNLRNHFAGASFVGTTAPTYTISGQINTATAVSGVSVALSGSQTASTSTDVNGNYSFTGILENGNYTVTPSHTNLTFSPLSSSFTNVTANQTANFTAAFLLQLALDDAGQVVAVDSMLHVRDPFPVINQSNVLNRGVDRNTRVAVFVTNFSLLPGESASSVVINLIGNNNQSYDIPAEDVRPLANTPYTQIIFRLPDSLTAGTSTLVVKGHGLTSNIGSMKIN